MKTHSILQRSAVMVLALQLLSGLAVTTTAVWHEWQLRLHALDASLSGRMDSLIGAIQDAETPQLDLMIDPDEFAAHTGDLYAVYDDAHHLVGANFSPDSLHLSAESHPTTLTIGAEHYRILQHDAVRVIDRNEHGSNGIRRSVTVLYAVRSGRMWHEVLRATRFYLVLSALQLLITAIFLLVILRKLLSPLRTLAAQAEAIAPNALEFQANDAALHIRELAPLADALHFAMQRVARAFERERQFLGDAAHELKTAVAVVRSSVQVVSIRERTNDEYKAALARILDDTSRVEALVMQMLTVARVEEQSPHIGPGCSIYKQVVMACDKLSPIALSGEISINFSASSEAMVPLRAEDLQVVLSNLLMNAIQHSPRGASISVTVNCTETNVKLHIEDCGSGIAPENLTSIFTRFYRPDCSRSRETGGAGLGLAICKTIIERAGGTILIDSAVGVGTRVTVELPCVVATLPNSSHAQIYFPMQNVEKM